MKLAPRHQFRSGELCPHGDPDCLCDVIVTQPVQIETGVRHWFFENALDELGEYRPTSRNMVELVSVVLGMHTLFRREVADVNDPTAIITYSTEHREVGPAPYRALPDDVRVALRNHYMCGTPWRIARGELDGIEISRQDMAKIYEFYARNKYNVQKRDSQKVTTVFAPRVCRHCGVTFVPRRETAQSCTERCRRLADRAERRAAAKAARTESSGQ